MLLPLPAATEAQACATKIEYRTQQGSPVAQIYLERVWHSPARWAVLKNNSLLPLDDDMVAYLHYEAQRRGVTIDEAYQEEIAGQERARLEAFTQQELEQLVKTSHPDERLLEGDEDCPF